MSTKVGDYRGGVRHIGCIRERCHVDSDTGCWLWRMSCATGTNTPHVRYQGKLRTVRRLVLELVGRPALDTETVVRRGECHEKCVRPEHQTALNRSAYMHWLNANSAMNGAAHAAARTLAVRRRPNVRLQSVEQAEQIRVRVANGEDRGELATEFGLSRSHLNRIARGKNWATKVTPVASSVWSFAAGFTGKARGQSFEGHA
jgi:hypothetical protein